uniref:Putative inactive poly ADP-ribose polymerase SRO3 isoform X2 n=1 Tax=Rhizophora mucronata TaxID=61149 RepID=A0A2P2J1Q7_RHIMU
MAPGIFLTSCACCRSI